MKFALLDFLERTFDSWFEKGYLTYALIGAVIIVFYMIIQVSFFR